MRLPRRPIFFLLLSAALCLVLAAPGRSRTEIHHVFSKGGEKVEFMQTRSELHAYWLPLLLVGARPDRVYPLGGDSLSVVVGGKDLPLPLSPQMPPPDG